MPELSPATLNHLFFGTAWAALGVAVILILWLVFRRNTTKVISEEPAQSKELTDMMILFQTMREVLHEQKALAKEFNQSLDRKVQMIREAANLAMEEHKRLSELQRELHDQIEEARQAIREMLRQQPGKQPDSAEKPHQSQQPELVESPMPIPERRDEQEAVSLPAGQGDMIDSWVGLDFADEPEEAESPEATLEMPDASDEAEDPFTVRSALRAILNLTDSVSESSAPVSVAAPTPVLAINRDNVPSLHLLIYEYSDAGMTVGQIARELGLGKAEVRLILNLRNK